MGVVVISPPFVLGVVKEIFSSWSGGHMGRRKAWGLAS